MSNALKRRSSPLPDPSFLAPVTTGWLRNEHNERASVNIVVEPDGNYFVWAVTVTPGHPRDRMRKEPIYSGAVTGAASRAANKAVMFFTTHGYKASPPASSARLLDAGQARTPAAPSRPAVALTRRALTVSTPSHSQPAPKPQRRRRFWSA